MHGRALATPHATCATSNVHRWGNDLLGLGLGLTQADAGGASEGSASDSDNADMSDSGADSGAASESWDSEGLYGDSEPEADEAVSDKRECGNGINRDGLSGMGSGGAKGEGVRVGLTSLGIEGALRKEPKGAGRVLCISSDDEGEGRGVGRAWERAGVAVARGAGGPAGGGAAQAAPSMHMRAQQPSGRARQAMIFGEIGAARPGAPPQAPAGGVRATPGVASVMGRGAGWGARPGQPTAPPPAAPVDVDDDDYDADLMAQLDRPLRARSATARHNHSNRGTSHARQFGGGPGSPGRAGGFDPAAFDAGDDEDEDVPEALRGLALRAGGGGGGRRGAGGLLGGAKSGRWEKRGDKNVFILDTGVELTGQEAYRAHLRLNKGGGGRKGRARAGKGKGAKRVAKEGKARVKK